MAREANSIHWLYLLSQVSLLLEEDSTWLQLHGPRSSLDARLSRLLAAAVAADAVDKLRAAGRAEQRRAAEERSERFKAKT